MEAAIIIILFLFIIFSSMVYERITNTKNLKLWIKNHYGKKPSKKEYNWKQLMQHWKVVSENIPEDERIDDITWDDLDINTVFLRINQCNSFVGEQVLYSNLHNVKKDNTKRNTLEQKINFFTNHKEEREAMQLLLLKLGKEEGSYYLPLFLDNLDTFSIPGLWKYRILQVLFALSVLPAVILQNPLYLFGTAIIFFINVIIYALGKSKFEIHLDTLTGIMGLVKAGRYITSGKTFTYEKEFHDLAHQADQFRRLSSRIGRMSRSKELSLSGSFEAIVYDYMIGSTLMDFIKYNKILRLLKGKQKEFMELYNTIGEIDMCISIASFRSSLPFYCIPEFHSEHSLETDEIYHPLIDEPVCNNVALTNNCIITGSNASGKSTFIKALAINAILAQTLHTCTAKRMVLPYARIITSMAVRDDLMAGESYYIREIKYLNRIIKSLSNDRFVICAIDEILRGTNTEERIAASAAILKYLNQRNCFAIVASHDIELTRILSDSYHNYHFREQIEEHDIVFDYKIHEGAATSKNAIRLLEYVNFPREIIEEAKKPFLKA